jgi:hypothetical protein
LPWLIENRPARSFGPVLDARDASKTGKIGREVLEREEDVGVLEVLMRQQQIDLLELRA